MDVKSCLMLCKPINFHNVCTIYPIEVTDYVEDSEYYSSLYLSYVLTKEVLSEEVKRKYENLTMFEIILLDKNYIELLITSLQLFCKTNNVRLVIEDNQPQLYFDDNKFSLNKNNFEEFSKIILFSGVKSKYKPKEIPTFETPEGYERWKNYEAQREKNAPKEDESLSSIINVVQIGGNYYIDSEVIKHWSVWKLMNEYSSIIGRDSYEKQYSQYLVSGDNKNIKEHWSELLKIK